MGTLRTRLLLSHLAVVVIGVVVLLVAGRRLGFVFVDNHLRSMGGMMSSMTEGDAFQLEEGITAAFNRALVWAAVVSGATAMAAATFAAVRVLRPLEEVRGVARRLATGSYAERVPVPKEAELAALATDVNALAQALEETEQRRLQLVSEVAHELRTPVATIKGYMEGLLDGVFEPDEETLTAAVREADRLERLAADLSALSSVEEARIELRLETIDLAQLAGEVAHRLRPQFDGQGVALTVHPGTPLTATVDADRMSQVLTNLIGNALSYTPTGGRVDVSGEHRADRVTIKVSDTGRGLTGDQLALIFERFYRADRSATGGTGIGLTIARSLARMHGGDISASSDGLGRGSTFVLTIPTHPQIAIPSRPM